MAAATLTSPEVVGAPARETLRCSHCGLVQFATQNRNCRKCRKPYVDPAQVKEAPTVQARKGRIKHGAAAKYDYSAAVKLLRVAKGWTQYELAKELEIPRTYVSKVENLRTDMNLKTMTRFASVFGVTMAEFISIAEVAALYSDDYALVEKTK